MLGFRRAAGLGEDVTQAPLHRVQGNLVTGLQFFSLLVAGRWKTEPRGQTCGKVNRSNHSKLRPVGQLPMFLELSHIHSSCIVYSCFALQRQSWVIATKTAQPAKPKIFTVWPFTEEVCQIAELSSSTFCKGGDVSVCCSASQPPSPFGYWALEERVMWPSNWNFCFI